MRRGVRGGRGRNRPREGPRREGSEGEGRPEQDRHVGHVRQQPRQEIMTETREQLFARLEALGFEKVSEMRNRGILDGEPAWVYEWLEERGIKRAGRGQQPAARGSLRGRALRRRRREIRALRDVRGARRPGDRGRFDHSRLHRAPAVTCVLDAQRRAVVDLARDDAVALELAQLRREHPLADAPGGALQLVDLVTFRSLLYNGAGAP